MRVQLGLALSILLLTGSSPAQTVLLPSQYSAINAENGLMIGWQISSEDRTGTQVDVYDREGITPAESPPACAAERCGRRGSGIPPDLGFPAKVPASGSSSLH